LFETVGGSLSRINHLWRLELLVVLLQNGHHVRAAQHRVTKENINRLSPGGLFIETRKPRVIGATTQVEFLVQEGQIRAGAVVRHGNPGRGVGHEIHGGQARRSSSSGCLVEKGPPFVLILHCDMIRIAKVDRHPSQKDSMNIDFKPGDVVRLKSGGKDITIIRLEDEGRCRRCY
jgi:hypothetical protein